MSREILFRGKRVDNGEWVEGSLITNVFYTEKDHESIPYILNADMAEYDCFEDFNEYNGIYEVDEETICQYTGLTDKNGKKIWEGDIIKYHFGEIYAPVKFGEYQSCFDSTSTSHVGFYVDWDKNHNFRKDLVYWIKMIDAEVVGNIFDNPELLEKRS